MINPTPSYEYSSRLLYYELYTDASEAREVSEDSRCGWSASLLIILGLDFWLDFPLVML